jgi:hypothetical protein
MKLLWLDELITLHIARLNSVSAIWNALARGADPNPPLIHIAVMLCRRLFGEYEFALRLPAVIGYWIGMLALFAFLQRRLSATWALAGTILSMAMAAFDYSYESRSYAVFYGFAMLALYAWSRAVEAHASARTRVLGLAGLFLSLSLGLCTNYFSVLAFFPVAIGETIRTISRASRRTSRWIGVLRAVPRAIDRPVWAVIALAVTPLLAFRPLIARSIAQFAPYAWNKVSLDQVCDSYTEMVEIVLYPLLALFVFTFTVRILGRFCAACRAGMRPRWIGRLATEQAGFGDGRRTLQPFEAAAVFSLMAYPFIGYAVASFRGGMLSPRFVIPVCFGFAIAGIACAYRIFGQLRLADAITLLFCLAWFCARESYVGYWYVEQTQCFYKVLDRVPLAGQETQPGEPIVIADPLLLLTFQHYAPAAMASRLVFPVDFPAIRHFRGEDSPEENLWAGRGWLYHVPIVTMAKFVHNAGEYLIIGWNGVWMIDDLRRHNYRVDVMLINTRAGAIGGFTPLSHETPVFFYSVGDRFYAQHPSAVPLIPFQASQNIPTGQLTP